MRPPLIRHGVCRALGRGVGAGVLPAAGTTGTAGAGSTGTSGAGPSGAGPSGAGTSGVGSGSTGSVFNKNRIFGCILK